MTALFKDVKTNSFVCVEGQEENKMIQKNICLCIMDRYCFKSYKYNTYFKKIIYQE